MLISDPVKGNQSNLMKRKWMKLFSMYDADNTGVLKVSDFQHLLDRLSSRKGWTRDSAEYVNLMDKLYHRWIHIHGEVKDSLGHKASEAAVTLDEWLLYHEKVLGKRTYREQVVEIEDLIFNALDSNASGGIDLKEWQFLFQVYGIPVIYAEDTFAKIDLNHNGCLTKPELLPLIEQFYCSQELDAPGNFIFGPL